MVLEQEELETLIPIIKLAYIIPKLQTKGVFQGMQTFEEIEAKTSREHRVKCLLANLPKTARIDLIDALKETNQEFLARMLTHESDMGN